MIQVHLSSAWEDQRTPLGDNIAMIMIYVTVCINPGMSVVSFLLP